MQFAERYPFNIEFTVTKNEKEDLVSQNLSPGSAAEFRLKLRLSRNHQIVTRVNCDIYIACTCSDRIRFAYAEVHLSGMQGVRGLVQRFDSVTSEHLLAKYEPDWNGIYIASSKVRIKLTGELLVENGCGPDDFAPESTTDVCLVVEGQELHVHRCLLGKFSPVFRTMLLGSFREGSTNPDAAPIELPGKSLSQFLELLATVYPPHLEMHSGRAKSLLPLLTEYQMDHLTQRCERALLQSPIYELLGGSGGNSESCRDASDIGLKLPQTWMDELLDHAYLSTVYQLTELQEKSVALLASVQTRDHQEALKSLLPDEILCHVFAKRVSILEGKIGRLNEELEGYRSKLVSPEA